MTYDPKALGCSYRQEAVLPFDIINEQEMCDGCEECEVIVLEKNSSHSTFKDVLLIGRYPSTGEVCFVSNLSSPSAWYDCKVSRQGGEDEEKFYDEIRYIVRHHCRPIRES